MTQPKSILQPVKEFGCYFANNKKPLKGSDQEKDMIEALPLVQSVPYIQTFKLQTFKDVNVLALHLSLLMVLPFHHLLPPLTCSLDASPCMPAVGLHYYTFQGTMLLLLMLSRFSRARLFATPWTAAHQAPLSMGFSRQEYWSRVPLPSLSRYYSVR